MAESTTGSSVGVVDTGRVLSESKSGKQVGERLQRMNARWHEQLAISEQQREQAQAKLKKLGQDAQPSQVFKAQHELRMLELTIRHTQEMAQAELEGWSDFYQTALSQVLAAQIEVVGKAKSLSMVLTGPNAQMPFVAQAIDITADAIEHFDRAFNIEKV
jgi:Skp family chaperone for outer membrane proteins